MYGQVNNFVILHVFRDCPGVGTSSGPNGKEVSYHGNVGGSSVGYKPPPQHSPQSRGPPAHFPQESVGLPANSPPLHINICGQVSASFSLLSDNICIVFFLKRDLCSQENTMRGPLLNMSPGLGASGVDMEYRRNSQGILRPLAQYMLYTCASIMYT